MKWMRTFSVVVDPTRSGKTLIRRFNRGKLLKVWTDEGQKSQN
jgi:hypothetical protein